ncbi:MULTISPECIES: phage tail assembly protein [unclassified Shinella]|uniref:phage tail assembly protein n=1 Tax=unclassified Shinella TaxID=2643062 RepID=UPI00234E5773|nr:MULTISPECIES: phage tail assembly protein [unclassified Shinella]MCO5153392.1 phage tail assembly protein [Shinella sp.]MDC7260571.1 phage tail assembly protein [Shinella sp. HY16]MDC7267466.1 phage tail assembly protein [Shinella sp. YZ44]
MFTFTLSAPIEHAGKTYSTLTFREAETGDLMVADKFEGQTSKVAAMLSAMCEMPLPAFKKIKAREFSRLMKEAAHMLGEPEGTPPGGTTGA